MNIKFYCDFYISEELEKNTEKVCRKLLDNTLQPTVYVITLSQGEQNHLDMFSALLFQQKIFENTPLLVVGIAKGYEDGLFLVEEIIKEVYDKTKGADIRSYIVNRQREYEKVEVKV